MGKAKQALLFALIAAAAAGAGYLTREKNLAAKSDPAAQATSTAAGAEALFSASLPDLKGQEQSVSQWRGKVLVVNFWATWCAPCREEIPEFIKMQEKYRNQGLLFVGIALDQKDKVEAYHKEVGFNYPVLIGGFEAIELSKQAGNRYSALPFTAIIDRSGKIAGTALGGLTQTKLEPIIKPLL